MKDEDWKKIKHFKKKENWGDPEKISKKLVEALDRLADQTGQKIIITCGTQGRHSDNSQHYLGRAADCVFPDINSLIELYDIYENARKIEDFKGIGLYPHWKYKGKTIGGLHLDVRRKESNSLISTWMSVLDSKGKQIYIALIEENLQKYGFK